MMSAAVAAPNLARFASAESQEGVLRVSGRTPLTYGGDINDLQIAWRLTGVADGPVVAALGGISAHRVVFSENGLQGWWDRLVGPGRALDSSRFRVLGIDYPGGSGLSTGPQPGDPFPSLSTYDQAHALAHVLDHLDIRSLHAIVGASYGGMVALAFGERFGTRVARLLTIGAADVTHPLATAWRSVQRHIVRRALARGDGAEGLELARALAMASYRSAEEFAGRFRQPPARDANGVFRFPVEDYLFARGADYATRYRPEAFLALSESIDLHAIDATRVRAPTTVVAFRQDQLVPVTDLRALAARLPAGRLVELDSICGHDSFLKDAAQLAPVFASTLENDP
jgi:homoserine O-acetyltransferase